MPPSEPAADDNLEVIYWHRELPPLDAEAMGEHTVEATGEAWLHGRFGYTLYR